MQRDYVKIAFKNGSYMDIVAARNSTRGGRRTSGLIEEAILVEGTILNEVILPQRFFRGLICVSIYRKSCELIDYQVYVTLHANGESEQPIPCQA